MFKNILPKKRPFWGDRVHFFRGTYIIVFCRISSLKKYFLRFVSDLKGFTQPFFVLFCKILQKLVILEVYWKNFKILTFYALVKMSKFCHFVADKFYRIWRFFVSSKKCQNFDILMLPKNELYFLPPKTKKGCLILIIFVRCIFIDPLKNILTQMFFPHINCVNIFAKFLFSHFGVYFHLVLLETPPPPHWRRELFL